MLRYRGAVLLARLPSSGRVATLAPRDVLAEVRARLGMATAARHRARPILRIHAARWMAAIAGDSEVLSVELELRHRRVVEAVVAVRGVAAFAGRAERAAVRVVVAVARGVGALARCAAKLPVGVTRRARGTDVLAFEHVARVRELERVPRPRDVAARALRAERALMHGVDVALRRALRRDRFEHRLALRVDAGVAVDARHVLVFFDERERRRRTVIDAHDVRARR